MNASVKKLASTLRNQLVFWHIFLILCAAGVGLGVRLFANELIAATITTMSFVGGMVVLHTAWVKLALRPTDFLSRAIAHVTNQASPEPSPDPAMLHTERAYFESLATAIYDLASQPPTPAETKQISHFDIQRNTPLPYLIISKDGIIKEVSNSLTAYVNVQSDQLVGKQINDTLRLYFSSEDTLENWLNFVAEKAVTLTRTWDRVKLTSDGGEAKQFDLAAHYTKDSPDGAEVVLALFDHTDRYSKDDAGASFVAMAVHELRTPLTIMRGYIEVFEDELAEHLNTEQAEFMRNLTAQAQQLTSFVSNIQNLARIQDNSLELVLKQEVWSECLNTTLDDLELRARTRKRTLIREIPTDLPTVAVDHSTISEVIVNIVENSIKYTHTDDPITIKSYVKDDNWVETVVIDHGIGIPDSLIGHVFDKFYRSHRTSKSVGGTGLGLYISKSIVDAHGGEIWVKSKEGEGSSFGFTVPTYASVADQVKSTNDGGIIRGAHGWIKNHTLYRG